MHASEWVSACVCERLWAYIAVFSIRNNNKCTNEVLPYLCLDDDDGGAAAIADFAPRIQSLFADVFRIDKSI